MRRYVLGDAQSEDGVINDKGMMGDIFYGHTVVGNNTYSIYTKMGATIPVLKNEIEDFFFARLGTGRTSQNRRATDAYANIYNCKIYQLGKYLHVAFLERYFMNTPIVVCCYNNESQI